MAEVAKKRVSPVTLMCEIAIMAAAGWVLDELQGAFSKGLFVNGGSIGIAMIPVILMCFRRGPIAGLATGFIMGIFDVLTGPFMVASSPFLVFVQVALDYVLAYPFVALAAVMKPAFDKAPDKKHKSLYLLIGIGIGTLGKLLCHYLAGILFWANPENFAWGLTNWNPYLYCLVYNMAFVIPCGILSALVMAMVFWKAPQLFLTRITEEKPVLRRNLAKWEFGTILGISVLSLGVFGYFLYRYIASFYYGDYGSDGSEIAFDQDSLSAWIIGLLFALFGAIALVQGAKGKYGDGFYPHCALFIGGLTTAYGLARLLRSYIRGKDPNAYWFWIGAGLLFLAAWIVYLVIKAKKAAKPE